ncbi:hypothetical protein RchiOBHm_Chr2g0119311 [Rosa chinensis]|uniref:Uncharacterized protein n=1 Tax=Rosa chinensis TaxID=74649 RepID=A0A2P6RS05_ROSCH|nr:hypothetical protein RchiOBHm_Chr2g0119311 [Rosa chinensis]
MRFRHQSLISGITGDRQAHRSVTLLLQIVPRRRPPYLVSAPAPVVLIFLQNVVQNMTARGCEQEACVAESQG